jgi:hypothetical protein
LIYRNEKWGEKKHYSLCNNGMGTWVVREFMNRCRKTELTLSTEEKIMFESKLKETGWYADIRR